MNWKAVFKRTRELAGHDIWRYGQEKSIRWVAHQLRQKDRRGVLVADEVGMGKTRVVMAAILATLENRGKVVAIVPPGLLLQWQTEWEDFLKTLYPEYKRRGKKLPAYAPLMLRTYGSLFDSDEPKFPLTSNKGRWVLMSHRFALPNLRVDSTDKQYILPALVKALQKDGSGASRNNGYWQFAKKYFSSQWVNGEWCMKEACNKNYDSCYKKSCNNKISLKAAADFLRKSPRSSLFKGLLPENQFTGDRFKEWFQSKDHGLKVIKELIGHADLLIIDEAHKSRNKDTILNKNIALLDRARKAIAMTATPLELNPEQWKHLFDRIMESFPKEGIIKEFEDSLAIAEKNPDAPAVLNQLIKKAEKFEKALRPYVTRRLRFDYINKYILPEDKATQSAHPHRNYDKILIHFDKIAKEWQSSVFGLESIGKAAKGLKTNEKGLNKIITKLKVADSRYAAGLIHQVEDENEEDDLCIAIDSYLKKQRDETDPEKEMIRGKLLRVRHWHN
ncbi:MAG: SNF2-related protein, partial [Elusimicrobiota bacterium]|nr:SNF2-related protein [Elusimicrobiota bacterium]